MDSFPLSIPYDLSRLSDAGAELEVVANDEERQLVAKWAGVVDVRSFTAKVTLNRVTLGRFTYSASLAADLTQSCVVTLEPVHSHLSLDVSRNLHLSKTSSTAGISQDEAFDGGDDGSEEIESPHYDLAGPLLEEFVLAIEPYPRAPGVVFEPQQSDRQVADNPFQVLKSLKNRD